MYGKFCRPTFLIGFANPSPHPVPPNIFIVSLCLLFRKWCSLSFASCPIFPPTKLHQLYFRPEFSRSLTYRWPDFILGQLSTDGFQTILFVRVTVELFAEPERNWAKMIITVNVFMSNERHLVENNSHK